MKFLRKVAFIAARILTPIIFAVEKIFSIWDLLHGYSILLSIKNVGKLFNSWLWKVSSKENITLGESVKIGKALCLLLMEVLRWEIIQLFQEIV